MRLYFLFLFMSVSVFSQTKNTWEPGLISLIDGTVLDGLVKLPTNYGMSINGKDKVKFKQNEDAKKQVFGSKEIDRVVVGLDAIEQDFYEYIYITNRRQILCKILKEGAVNYYSRTIASGYMHSFSGSNDFLGSSMVYTEEGTHYYIKKNTDKKAISLLRWDVNRGKFFIHYATTYFSDCPTLVSRIEEKQLTVKNIPSIVDDYNQCAE